MNKEEIQEQLKLFAMRLGLIASEIKHLEELVTDTLYQSQAKYYGKFLDEDIELLKYKAGDIKQKLIFIDDFLSQEAFENLEAQKLIQDIKNEVNNDPKNFASNYKEEI